MGDIRDETPDTAVKAASTAAVAADPALVVAVSPNNVVTTSIPDQTASGSIAANSTTNNLAATLSGRGNVSVNVAGTWTGTMMFEGTIDGSTWFTVVGIVLNNGSTASQTTVNGQWWASVGGMTQFRVRSNNAGGTGAATVTIVATATPSVISLGASTSIASIANPLPAGTNVIGNVVIAQAANITHKGRGATFRIPGLAGTVGQKLLSIHNATGSTIKVDIEKITIDTVATAVIAVTVLPPVIRVYKVTVLPSGGAVVTKVSRDSTLAASSANVTLLQGASADGTGVSLTATLPAGAVVTEEFAPRLITAAGYEMFDRTEFFGDSEITLNALEGLVVMLDYTLATQNPTSNAWLVGIEWTERT